MKQRSASIGSRLEAAFQRLSRISRFSGAKGDSVDRVFFNEIAKTALLEVVTSEMWSESAPYEAVRPLIRKEEFFPLPMVFDKPMLVDKPNGTQDWPDALVLFRRRALPIEFKSAKNDSIVWNSGLPQPGGIYVFNGSTNRPNCPETTYFLGEAIISSEEREILIKAREANAKQTEDYNQKLSLLKSAWSLYPRPMHNYKKHFLGHEESLSRERAVIEFVRNLQWE
jgi:hypothetical protein